jgi:uncharacterized membrane protein
MQLHKARWSWPHLLLALVIGLAAYLISGTWFPHTTTRVLIAWDLGVIALLCAASLRAHSAGPDQMRERANARGKSGGVVLILTILAAVVSVGALTAELAQAKGDPDAALRVVVSATTIVLSWLFVQTVFALHYAHVYYRADASGRQYGGLAFGDSGEPDYWDFFHFSIVVGATAQTADIVFTSKKMRRVGTLHSLVAFAFNTAVLATMISITTQFL